MSPPGAATRPGRPSNRTDPLTAGIVAAMTATGAAAGLSAGIGRLRPAAGLVALLLGVAAGWGVAAACRGEGAAGGLARRGFWVEAAALVAFLAVSMRQFGWLVFEREGRLLTLLPSNFGDLPLHWTYVQQLAVGASFWPQNPIFTGEPLRYPLGVDLLTAVFVQFGAPLPLALRLMGMAAAGLTAIALRRWGGALAVAGFLFSGGFAGLQIVWTGALKDYQDEVAWKNLYLTLFVPQRGFLLALPAGLVLLWSWRQRLLRREPGLASWIEGLLWGTLPLVHLHSFAFVSLLAGVWALGGRSVRALLPSFAWAVLPAIWAVWQVTAGFRGAALVGWHPGWMMGGAHPVVFLLVNFGVWLPLALAAGLRAGLERRREELLLLAPALAVFAALFVVRLAPWEWDNTKVMLWCYLATLPPIGGLVLARTRLLFRTAAVSLLFFSGLVSVLAASVGRSRPELELLDRAEYEGVCAALAPLGRDARVATVQTHNHPVALCGQPIVAGYSGHLWSHGLDAQPVERDLARLFAGDEGWQSIARRLDARYLFWGHRELAAFPTSRRPWVAQRPVAAGGWGALYEIP